MRISDWSSDVCSSDLDHLNAPTIGMRLRYAQLLHQANIDDDVKVLVIRGAGDDFGTGQDLPEFMDAVRSDDGLLREVQLEGADVTYPGQRSFRHGAITTQSWFTDPRGGCRSQIGRASCRERVCQSGSISVGAVALKKKTNKSN